MTATLDRVLREREHFEALVSSTGESWWGHTTPAGSRRLQRRAAIVARRLAGLASPELLEIGCGTGPFTVELLAAMPAAQLTAGDLSPASLERAAAKCGHAGRIRFEVQDITRLDHPDNIFDAVVGNAILHHVDLAPALAEIFRVLRPGGLMLFFEPNLANPQIAFDIQLRRRLSPGSTEYSEDERPFLRWPLRRAVLRAGFGRVIVEPIDFLHPLVPGSLIGVIDTIGRMAERIPILREISGSLSICAVKPSDK
jgi:SAM-dependent methyltransferase